jgi:amino acid transporter
MAELRRNNLSFIEAIGQSIASVSPTFTPALGVAVVGGMAGSASWLVYTLAMVAMVIVAFNIAKLAKRIPAAGSFFLYVSRTLGPSYGLLAGWAMLVAYLGTTIALTAATSLFLKATMTALGITLTIPNIVYYAIISIAIWLLATRDIKFSSRLSLTLEGISVAMILVVCFVVWRKFGFEIDPKQVHLTGASFGSVAPAIVFAIFSWVGFESAATLGAETRNPGIVIPRAIILTAIIAGVFFISTTAIVVMGFSDNAANLGGSSAPLIYISSGLGSWVALLIYIGATISCFACALGQYNAFARMLFSLGRYQFVHKSMGMVHAQHHTPYFALTLGAIANFVVCSVFASQGEINLVGYFGTIATFGFITVYFLCSICAPVLLMREKTAKPADFILGGLGAIAMALAFFGSIYPVPSPPYNYFPYGFVAYMVIGIIWFFVLKMKAPTVLLGIKHDLEGLGAGD